MLSGDEKYFWKIQRTKFEQIVITQRRANSPDFLSLIGKGNYCVQRSKILPGFKMLSGSKSFFKFFIMASSSLEQEYFR